MNGIKRLRRLLETLADEEHYLFSPRDFSSAFPELSPAALKMLIGRAVKDDLLRSVCRGIYLYDKAKYPRGYVLYHTASKLRASTLSYISLESALSDAGIISQIPFQWLTLMTAGRSGIIDCGAWGSLEFRHTSRSPADLAGVLVWDTRCRLWRAPPRLALADMKRCRRSMELVDWNEAHEFV